jgi:hypothetical protein
VSPVVLLGFEANNDVLRPDEGTEESMFSTLVGRSRSVEADDEQNQSLIQRRRIAVLITLFALSSRITIVAFALPAQ